jgi:hypothetical protein
MNIKSSFLDSKRDKILFILSFAGMFYGLEILEASKKKPQ